MNFLSRIFSPPKKSYSAAVASKAIITSILLSGVGRDLVKNELHIVHPNDELELMSICKRVFSLEKTNRKVDECLSRKDMCSHCKKILNAWTKIEKNFIMIEKYEDSQEEKEKS